MMNETITAYVDRALAFTARYKAYLMYENEPVTPSMAAAAPALEQLPRRLMMEHPEADGLLLELATAGNHFWEPVDAAVTDEDILGIEKQYGIRLPDSYKAYLQYKHFYTIFFQPDIKLYPKPVDDWQAILFEHNDEMREDLLEQGYFAIGDYSDHGVICLALDDHRVVMIDHEEDEEVLGSSFVDFLENILQQGEATVRDLKDWEKRIYKS